MKFLHVTVALSAGVLLLGGYSYKEQILAVRSEQKPDAAEDALPTIENNLKAARKLAWEASVLVQKPPHPVKIWQQARVKWRQAIRLLEEIPEGAVGFDQAREKIVTYRANYAIINARLNEEQAAATKLEAAQTLAWQAAITAQNPPHSLRVWQRASQKWREAIELLEPIPSRTFAAIQGREKLEDYRRNYSTITRRMATETLALETLQKFVQTATRLNTVPTHALAGITSDELGIEYEDYSQLVQKLESSLDELSGQVAGRSHPAYTDLRRATEDYKLAVKLWNSYLDLERSNSQWLYDGLLNQLVSVSQEESTMLTQKYGVKTYFSGSKVSLRFTVWEIWNHATEQIRKAQQKTLSLK